METVRIRPHHIGLFADYYLYNIIDDEDKSEKEGYGSQFMSKVKNLYDKIIFGKDIEVLTVDGSSGDSICDLCKRCCKNKNKIESLDDMEWFFELNFTMVKIKGIELKKHYSSDEFLEIISKSMD